MAGQNIGSCTTTLISSVGGSKEAKQTACIHLYFNLIGTILFLSAYYMLNAIFAFPFANRPINGFEIVLVHTIFNLFATCLMLPVYKTADPFSSMERQGQETPPQNFSQREDSSG